MSKNYADFVAHVARMRGLAWSYVFVMIYFAYFFFFSSRRRHTRLVSDWSSDVCSSDLHLACRHRARSQGSSRQRLLLLQDQGRDWRGDRRTEAGAAVRAAAAMERSGIDRKSVV